MVDVFVGGHVNARIAYYFSLQCSGMPGKCTFISTRGSPGWALGRGCFSWCCCNGPLVSVASAHRSSRSEWGHGNEETVDKKCFRQCFLLPNQRRCRCFKFSFWRTVLFLLWSGLDAAVCWVFLHAGCLSKSIYVLSLDHYWLFIVLWSCYYLPVVDQNRFL